MESDGRARIEAGGHVYEMATPHLVSPLASFLPFLNRGVVASMVRYTQVKKGLAKPIPVKMGRVSRKE